LILYVVFVDGNKSTTTYYNKTHGEPQLLGRSQVVDSEWPPDMVVSCE